MTVTISKTPDFTSTQSTPLLRIYGLIMGVLHIPTLIAGAIGVLFSILLYPLLLVTIPAFVIGTTLFRQYWGIYKDRLSIDEGRKIWRITLGFNIFLLGPAILASIYVSALAGWLVVGYISISIFLSSAALKEIKEVPAASYI